VDRLRVLLRRPVAEMRFPFCIDPAVHLGGVRNARYARGQTQSE
jgi:hypothetical protein